MSGDFQPHSTIYNVVHSLDEQIRALDIRASLQLQTELVACGASMGLFGLFLEDGGCTKVKAISAAGTINYFEVDQVGRFCKQLVEPWQEWINTN